jgi:hypothetical protein
MDRGGYGPWATRAVALGVAQNILLPPFSFLAQPQVPAQQGKEPSARGTPQLPSKFREAHPSAAALLLSDSPSLTPSSNLEVGDTPVAG